MTLNSSWHSYPSIYNLGHPAIKDLLAQDCYVQEKVDGSQFSFGLVPSDDGALVLRVRSKGVEMYTEAPHDMFKKAVAAVKAVEHLLTPGWTYRGEFLAKPAHNALAYDRVPTNNIILFDVGVGDQEFMNPLAMAHEAERLGFESVPLLLPHTPSLDEMRHLLDNQVSVLGGQKIEGVVVKQWPSPEMLYGKDKKLLIGKFVSERFREVHKEKWGEQNPTGADIVDRITEGLRTPARWHKAVQHLRDEGKLEGSPRDIGLILKEIPDDVLKECREDIEKELWKHFWPHIKRKLAWGFPEWYKDQLMRQQFEQQQEGAVNE
jgi:hypothetical protein